MSEIEVGDRVTYRYLNTEDKQEFVSIIGSIEELESYKRMIESKTEISSIEILKIERPKYEVVEEKKELLTEEEREFLKQYIKMSSLEITHIIKESNIYETCVLKLTDDGTTCWAYFRENYFKGLEIDKEYDLSELSLEKEYCECCGVEITKENKALDNMFRYK